MGEPDARALVDLLKLAAAGRMPDSSNAVKIITEVLMGTFTTKFIFNSKIVLYHKCVYDVYVFD